MQRSTLIPPGGQASVTIFPLPSSLFACKPTIHLCGVLGLAPCHRRSQQPQHALQCQHRGSGLRPVPCQRDSDTNTGRLTAFLDQRPGISVLRKTLWCLQVDKSYRAVRTMASSTSRPQLLNDDSTQYLSSIFVFGVLRRSYLVSISHCFPLMAPLAF